MNQKIKSLRRNALNGAALICLLFVALSCSKDGFCPHGNGSVTTRTISVDAFTALEFSPKGHVTYIPGPEHKIEIIAEENIVNLFKTTVKDSTLKISSECYTATVTPQVKVYGMQLSKVAVTGTGQVVFDGTGLTNNLDLTITGSGYLGMYQNRAAKCKVNIQGAGSCEVTVNDELDIVISGNGTVYYKGYPTVNQQVTGSGKVVSKN